jgi:hypothetical protein
MTITSAGFYRLTDRLSYATTAVYAPNITLLADDRDTYFFPVEGWYWFESLLEAEQFFNVNGATASQWVQFGITVMADPAVNAMLGVLFQSAPGLFGGLIIGLQRASDGDFTVFLNAWNGSRQIGAVTAELATSVASMASQFNLPAEFVGALTAIT